MPEFLTAEPQTDGDATFRNFQRHNLRRAADHFDVTVTAAPTFGWRLRSISAPVTGQHSPAWLRVVSEEPQWARGEGWTGNADANVITAVRKPTVLDVYEWPEHDWRNQRAELMLLLPGTPAAAIDVPHSDPPLPETWWTDLSHGLRTLAETPTDRVYANQARVTQRIRQRFGDTVETTVASWTTAHADLHWANLMAPDLGIVDWELWGTAPAGLDAATLYSYSLLVPETAERIHGLFADLLDTPTGRIAQLYVAARLLRRIESSGDHPELAEPLTTHAARLLAAPTHGM
ncbi:aminoglycoside phosphotransferase [Amycolatopsis sp. NPDC059021]|uniref:aminoglycoside phosphotransferase n=1 Tax=Amycolatopsis sp. NPDC059021 TaxID=3346704 RepID=UPI0036701A8A